MLDDYNLRENRFKRFKNDFIIYYAINNSPKYLNYVCNSIKSLEKFGTFNIKIFIYGYIDLLPLEQFKNIEVIINPEEPNYNWTSLKWYATEQLSNLNVSKIIFVDADTYFFESPETILKYCSKYDFYAREELATKKGENTFYLGKRHLKPSINHEILTTILNNFDSKSLPIFNTGFMVFNNNLINKVAEKISFYKSILKKFLDEKLVYPSSNSHLLEEIVSSIVLGKIDNMSYGLLDRNYFPFYYEYKEGEVNSFGLFLHILSAYYDEFLKELEKYNAS